MTSLQRTQSHPVFSVARLKPSTFNTRWLYGDEGIRGTILVLANPLLRLNRIEYRRPCPKRNSLARIGTRNAGWFCSPSTYNHLRGRSTSRRHPMDVHLFDGCNGRKRCPRKFRGQFSKIVILHRRSLRSGGTKRYSDPGRDCGQGDFPDIRRCIQPNNSHTNHCRCHVNRSRHLHSL